MLWKNKSKAEKKENGRGHFICLPGVAFVALVIANLRSAGADLEQPFLDVLWWDWPGLNPDAIILARDLRGAICPMSMCTLSTGF